MHIGRLITQAFGQARAKYPELQDTWRDISYRFHELHPIEVSIQREGSLDLLIRAMEEESLTLDPNLDPLMPHYMFSLSHYWIGGMYEIFRLINDRGFLGTSELATTLFRDLTLIRIALEKLELAGDKKLKEPLALSRYPANGDSSDDVIYDPKDKLRTHLMPTAHSKSSGSILWHVTDLKHRRSYWVERRWISDKTIELWKKAETLASNQ
jgi:hypothetical protein